MFTDGSRLDSGAAGYSVVWQNGQRWVGIKTHMAITRRPTTPNDPPLPELWKQGQITPERVTVSKDAQAAIKGMASAEPGPGQL
jgi:hypothetical protein